MEENSLGLRNLKKVRKKFGPSIHPTVHLKDIQAFLRALKSPYNCVLANCRALKSHNVNASRVNNSTQKVSFYGPGAKSAIFPISLFFT